MLDPRRLRLIFKFFKTLSIKIYTVLHAFKPIVEALLSLLLRYLQKGTFWTHQPLLQMLKNVDLLFYFLRTGIKKSHSSQDYTADDSSNRCFKCSKMQLFEPMCETLHCRGEEWFVYGGWFSSFLARQLANKWLPTTQNWLFSVVLVVGLRGILIE